jgi:hypothetical protein
MATTENRLGIEGSIGDITIYYNKLLGKYLVRTKGGMSKKKFDSSESCASIRNNVTEFSNASTYAANFRKAIAPLAQPLRDKKFTWRLVQTFKAIVHNAECDKVNINKHLFELNGEVLNMSAKAFKVDVIDTGYSKAKGAEITLRISFRITGMPKQDGCLVRGLMRRIDVVTGEYEKGNEVKVKVQNIKDGDEKEVRLRFKRTLSSGNIFLILSLQFYETVNRRRSMIWDCRMYGGVVFYLE